MYYIKLGNQTLRGYATAAAAWSDRDLQVRLSSISLADFKARLDAGQILQFYALYVFLDGEAAIEDLSKYNESDYAFKGPDVVVPESDVSGADMISSHNSDYITWHCDSSCRYAVRNNNSKEP